MKFQIEFSSRAVKDLKKFSLNNQKLIIEEALNLETAPFQFKTKIKRIKSIKFPCCRLRIDIKNDSFRMFYGIENNVVYVLRIISKKDADKILKHFKKLEFPPKE